MFEVLREAEIVEECRKRFESASETWLVSRYASERPAAIILNSMQAERDILVAVEGFLSACSRISLVFFPQKSSGPFAVGRAETLRQLVRIGDNHPIGDRKLRNHWAHFDERIDAEVEKGNALPIGYYIASWDNFSPNTRSKVLRLIDPGAEAVYVLGEKFSLEALGRAVDHIGQQAAIFISETPSPEEEDVQGS